MHPSFYRSASPQSSGSARDQVARTGLTTLYQGQYVGVQDMFRMHPAFGFPNHAAHPGLPTGQFLPAGSVGFHSNPTNEMPHNLSRNNMEPPRITSPSRRRQSFLTTDYPSERERYVGGVSPSEGRSPSSHSQAHPSSRVVHGHSPNHLRSASPRQQQQQQQFLQHNSNYPSNRSIAAAADQQEHRQEAADQRYAINNHKRSRTNDFAHHDNNVEGPLYRSGSQIKQEHPNRPLPLEAISPPAAEDLNDAERTLHLLQIDIKTIEKSCGDCEATIGRIEADLKASELKKEEHEKNRKAHQDAARSDSPEAAGISDVARRIIAENRKIAEAEHRATSKRVPLLPGTEPNVIRHHPSDMMDVMQVVRDFQKQRPWIVLRLKKDRQAKQIRERYLKERYKQLSQAYLSKLEKTENNAKKKAREAKMREYYERQFPELKKIREEKARDGRLGLRPKNDTDTDSSVIEDTPEDLEKYHRSAVLVPMLLDAKDRSRHFFDRNRLVENCAADYKESISNSFWTQEEKDIFRDRYLQRPKDFAFISAALKRKSVHDCIQYYYLTKSKEKYKQLVKKYKALRIRRGPNKRLQSTEEPSSPSKCYLSGLRLDNRNETEDVRAIALTVVCPARKCQARRRTIKRLFRAPVDMPKFREVSHLLDMPDTATSCCKYCVYYLEKKLGLKKWSAQEIEALKSGINQHGPNWNLISVHIPSKRVKDVVQYYRSHSAEFALPPDTVIPPNTLSIFDDEYSPFSASSSSEGEETAMPQNNGNEPRKNSNVRRTHSDDSNATLSADEMDEQSENKPKYLTKIRDGSNLHQGSFDPNHLPVPEHPRLPFSVVSGDQKSAASTTTPACVRDLIHSAIEKNLDKPLPFGDPFRRPPESLPPSMARRLELDEIHVRREREETGNQRGIQLNPMRGPNDTKSPSRMDLNQSRSPHLASPQLDPSKNRPGLPQMQNKPGPATPGMVHPSYQFSTRASLAADFATSRKLHAEQVTHPSSEKRQGPPFGNENGITNVHPASGPGPGHLPHQVDPRIMQFYPQFMYNPNAGAPVYPPVMESYIEGLISSGLAQGITPRQNSVSQQQRSIILGTGRPGGTDDPASSSERLQTLAANRGLLSDNLLQSDKRKPDVITLDDSNGRDRSPNNGAEMRFHPAVRLMNKADGDSEEPNPNLTAGSLINDIITRRISAPFPGNDQPKHNPQSASKVAQKKEDGLSSSSHKPFTLGEHIEQIIASDFSRRDLSQSLGAVPGLAASMYQSSFPMRAEAMRMGDGVMQSPPPLAQMFTAGKAPSTSVASTPTVEYEPISPPEKEGSDSEEDTAGKGNSS